MGVTVDSSIPDMSKAASRRMFIAAVDAGLDQQRTHLAKHFTRQAFTLYPREYSKSGAKSRAMNDARKRQFQGKTKAQKSTIRRKLKRSPKRSIDRKNELPLVKSGDLKRAALRGPATKRGNPIGAGRAMSIGVPQYLFQNPAGGFNKHIALTAITSAEEQAVADEMDKIIDKELNKPRISKRKRR